MAATLREKVESRLGRMKLERTSFDGHYKELSDFTLPVRGRFLTTDRNKGKKRNTNIIDNTGTLALRTLTSGLVAGLTSPARPWFRLGTQDPDLSEFGPVRTWLNDVERLMRDVFTRSNIYNVFPTAYQEIGLFATGAFLLSEDFKDTIRGYNYTAGEYYISTNSRGEVDTIYRESPWTVAQLVEKFGKDKVSKAVMNLYNKGQLDEWVTVIQAIEPNDDRIPSMKDAKNKRFRSVYIEQGSSGKDILGISGYDEFPVMCPRWTLSSGDIYGTGCPGMDSLGDVKQLQMQQKRKGQAIDKMVNPPLSAPQEMIGKRISGLPGDVSYYNSQQGNGAVAPMYQVSFSISELKEDMMDVRDRIRSAYFADLFLMLSGSQQAQPITAREVAERHEEKLLMLGPVLERFNGEMLDTTINRTFNIMARNNMLPPPPEDVQGLDLKVEYISLLAQAQRAIGVSSINQLVGYVGGIAQLKPDIIDKIDFDQSIDEVGSMLGVPARVVRSDDAVLEIRDNRAADAAAEQQQAASAQAAENAKTLSETNVEGDNALAQILRGGV